MKTLMIAILGVALLSTTPAPEALDAYAMSADLRSEFLIQVADVRGEKLNA